MWQPCPTVDLSGGQFFVAMRWRWSFFKVIRYRCFLDTLSHVTIATDAIIWTSPSLIICFFHGVLLVFRIFQGIFLVVYGFWLFKVCCRQRCNFLLNHQDRCFWGSLTIVWDYFQWSPTIGPAMWCLRYIAQVYIEHNGLMLSATPKSSEMISLSKGRKEKMG